MSDPLETLKEVHLTLFAGCTAYSRKYGVRPHSCGHPDLHAAVYDTLVTAEPEPPSLLEAAQAYVTKVNANGQFLTPEGIALRDAVAAEPARQVEAYRAAFNAGWEAAVKASNAYLRRMVDQHKEATT